MSLEEISHANSEEASRSSTWIGKEETPRLEPRVLLEDQDLSYHARKRVSEKDIFDNILIHGDNLLALRALEQEFAGQVKCVFIDPPYNTGSAFSSYDDGLEHSIWLGLMRDRLVCLRRLLSDEGTLWVTLDDHEAHYFKVLCDEIFGRNNFIGTVIWEKSDSPRMDARFFSSRHDFLLVYAKDVSKAQIKRLSVEELPKHYNKVDNAGTPYYLKPLRAMGGEDRREDRPTLYFAMKDPDGNEVVPTRQDGSDGRWRWSSERVERDADAIEWVSGRDGWKPYYRVYAKSKLTARPIETIWTHAEVGSNRTSKAEIKALFGEKAFDTPKPEALIARIISVSTGRGDLVLDSFLGSGTTAAVAQKLQRRWIGIEVLDHARTLVLPRITKVIDGEDEGGATTSCGWQGGGGFRFYNLAPSLLEKDNWGNWIVSKDFNAEMLAEAMCKLEGLQLRARPGRLLDPRQVHRDRLHLRDHAESQPRTATLHQR